MSSTDKRAVEDERMLAQALEVLSNRAAHAEDRRAARHLVSVLVRESRCDDDTASR